MPHKKGIVLMIASFHESQVAMSLKRLMDTLIHCPRGRLRFPPWCYVRRSMISLQPCQSGRLGDDYDYDVPTRLGRPRRKENPSIVPP